MINMYLRISAIILCICIHHVTPSLQLECYICQNQEDNKSKCVETVKTCESNQDKCHTEVRWSSVPHWTSASQKQFFISKRCASRDECPEDTMAKNPRCDRIWYNDWNCTNCCSGDKCNYYVTLAGQSLTPLNSIIMLSLSFITICFYKQLTSP